MFNIITDLDPGDSFFGGRVGGYKLFWELDISEKIFNLFQNIFRWFFLSVLKVNFSSFGQAMCHG